MSRSRQSSPATQTHRKHIVALDKAPVVMDVGDDFDRGNDFTAKHLFKLLINQEGPWRDEGFIFLHWMETLAHKHY